VKLLLQKMMKFHEVVNIVVQLRCSQCRVVLSTSLCYSDQSV